MSTSESSVASRLSSIASHLKPSKPRVVVCRDLGPDVMPLLTDRTDIEVRKRLGPLLLLSLIHEGSSSYGHKIACVKENGCSTTSEVHPV